MNYPILKSKQGLAIAIVILIGVVLAALILFSSKQKASSDEHDDHAQVADHKDDHKGDDAHKDDHKDEKKHAADAKEKAEPEKNVAQKGPHGGKLFNLHGYALEVTIFEQDTPPEFRVYTYQDGKALAPGVSPVVITLKRLGREPQIIKFAAEKDYLKGNTIVDEPHSFKVVIDAQYAGKSYQFGYEQIEARVQMSAKQLQQNGVEIQTAVPMKLQSTLNLLGEVYLNEDRLVQIVPRVAGMVESVAVNAGDKVSKGQLLAVISSPALADQRSDVLAAQKRQALARSNFEREKKLWEEKISAQQDFLNAQNTLQEAEITFQSAQQKLASLGVTLPSNTNSLGNLTRYEIRSPIAGTITDKQIATGQALKEDAAIFTVADLTSVWVEVTVPAKDLLQLKLGQTAQVKANAFDATANGKLSYIGALVGEQTRSAKARLVLPNVKGLWYPGLTVGVLLQSNETDVAVAVANEAIQSMKEVPSVFGRYGDAIELRPLELGRSNGKFTEVIKGLQAGEAYVAKNSFLIKADIGKSAASHDH
jgi:cobalt-zinc-cadmium efflux system membrane fusion protein